MPPWGRTTFLHFESEAGTSNFTCTEPRATDWEQSRAHNLERATPILGPCHGVFTDQFIFRHIIGHFFPRKSPPNLWGHSKYKILKWKTIRYQKAENIVLGLKVLLTGLWNLKGIQNSRQNRSKSKLVHENAVTREWKLFAPPYGLLEQYILSFRSPDTQKLALGIHIKSGKKKWK